MGFRLGVCYYPEHWPQARWATDARLMREAGLSIVRIGEFAWAQMEPEEGRFDWAWLDRAVDTLSGEGLAIVMGTPTPTPPAWLVQRYPEVLPVDSEGRGRRFGSRRHVCPSSPQYYRLTDRIVAAMAERYGRRPEVIGWQIDNEFGCHDTARCFCDKCGLAFREWLRSRYGTLHALNEAWGTAFWSQWYTDWEQIGPPILAVTEQNPSQVLDYYRFSSDAWVKYEAFQARLLRERGDPQKFISHNYMGNFPDLDYHKLGEPLDLVTWDSYPTGYAEVSAEQLYMPGEPRAPHAHDVGDPYVTGFCHAITRGIKQAPFWVMEQQCGHINWALRNTGVAPGAVRLWTWHALASGAEAVVYFRWRACRFAQEQMHSGLRKHDGSADLGYDEVMAMKGERGLMDEVDAAAYAPEVAILNDYEDLWAIQLQPHNRDYSYQRGQFALYRACQRLGIGCDLVSPDADLSRYKLVLAPALTLSPAELAARLRAYVEGGGHLVLGIRSGFKTESNVVTEQPLPGVFRELVGVDVRAWHSVPAATKYPLALGGAQFDACAWAEALVPGADARAVAEWTGVPFAGTAALTERQAGAGSAWYWGWHPGANDGIAVMRLLAGRAGVSSLPEPLPEGVLLVRRGPRKLWFNFTDHAQSVEAAEDAVIVPPRDVAIS
jgi:beta-galactosidase